MPRRLLVASLAALLVLVVAACGDDGDDVGTGTGTGADPTDGPTEPGGVGAEPDGEYVATAITEGGADRPLVDGSELRLTFTPVEGEADALPRLEVSAGCNQISASYDRTGDLLVIEPGVTTEMGCDPALMDQDAWLADVLTGEVTWSTEGDTLTLSSGDVVLTLVDRAEVSPDLAIVGPTWTLDTLVEGDAASSVPDGVTATIAFTDDGTYQISTGCNTGSGAWTTPEGGGPDSYEIEPAAVTRMACKDDGAAEVEAAMSAVFDGFVTMEVVEQRLSVTQGTTGQALGFTPG